MEGTWVRREGWRARCFDAACRAGWVEDLRGLLRESQEKMYMKAGQMKELQIHNTLSQVLGVRNNSTFRIFQLLDRLYLCILCNINIRGWGRTL